LKLKHLCGIFVRIAVLSVYCDCQYCNKQYVQELFCTFC